MLTKIEIEFCINALEDYSWTKKTKSHKLSKHIEVLESRNRIKEEDSVNLILEEKALIKKCDQERHEAEFLIKKLKKEL